MADLRIADVVVIGGGIRGCTIALFLSRAGMRVALVERRFPAYMASSANGGEVNVTDKRPAHYTAMSLQSSRMYPEFIGSLENDIFLQQKGILHVALNQEEMERLEQRVEELRQIPGLRVHLLDARQAKELVPALAPEVVGGYVSPDDGLVEVLKLVPAIVHMARRYGATILSKTEVTGIVVEGGRVRGVATDRGRISTPTVVNAAGVRVPHIGRMAGVTIPVDPEHGHLVISEPYPRLLPIPTEYVMQWPNGSIMIGTSNTKIGYDLGVHPEWLPVFLKDAMRLLPELRNVKAMRVFANIRPMPPDRLPIYDRVPGVEGLYIAVGHSGITLAPLTGKIFADLITAGRTDMDLGPYSLSRFSAGTAN
jgi:sarcosine oxidase subunit beta